jgi:hypothetical protein
VKVSARRRSKLTPSRPRTPARCAPRSTRRRCPANFQETRLGGPTSERPPSDATQRMAPSRTKNRPPRTGRLRNPRWSRAERPGPWRAPSAACRASSRSRNVPPISQSPSSRLPRRHASVGRDIPGPVAEGPREPARYAAGRQHRREWRSRVTTQTSGAPGRIRTCDLRLRRPTLYPLSYGRATQRDRPRCGGRRAGMIPRASGGRKVSAGRHRRAALRNSPGGPARPRENRRRIRSGSRRSRFVAVPVKGRPAEADRLLPRYKGIYHVGCTDYPNPTYP